VPGDRRGEPAFRAAEEQCAGRGDAVRWYREIGEEAGLSGRCCSEGQSVKA
jgi:hypothetical protein